MIRAETTGLGAMVRAGGRALSEYTGSGNRAPRRRTSDVELLVFSRADAAAIAAEAR